MNYINPYNAKINYVVIFNMAIPKFTVYKLMKEAGAKKVSEDAAALLAKYLEKVAKDVTLQAMKVAEQSKRVTVKEKDIRTVLEIRGEKL